MVLRLRTSRIAYLLRLVVYSASILSIFYIDLPVLSLFGVGLLTLLLIVWDYFQGYVSQSRLQKLSFNGDCWELESNLTIHEVLSPRIKFLSEYLIILEFRQAVPTSALPIRLLLFWDSVEQQQWLQLRRFLRFEYSALHR